MLTTPLASSGRRPITEVRTIKKALSGLGKRQRQDKGLSLSRLQRFTYDKHSSHDLSPSERTLRVAKGGASVKGAGAWERLSFRDTTEFSRRCAVHQAKLPVVRRHAPRGLRPRASR